jgi:hypothetical protein
MRFERPILDLDLPLERVELDSGGGRNSTQKNGSRQRVTQFVDPPKDVQLVRIGCEA